jgi:hypothetical protein
MLERLLRLIAEGGVSTCEDLAQRLTVNRPMLEAMLEELVRLGYLRAVATGCSGHCAGCSMAGCSVIGTSRVWALTDMGARAVPRGTAGAAHSA